MTASSRPSPLSRALPLLVLSVFINYIDRGNLSIAAPLLKDELGLSASQLGILLSSFFWTYAFFQLVSGWLVDRFNVNWIIALGFFIWSLATAVTGLLHAFAALLTIRLILGIGESVAYPSYSRILAQHCPECRRGFANAAIAVGLSGGSAFGLFAGGILMARFGWRPFFIVLGLVCLVWLLPWFKWMPRTEPAAVVHARTGPGSRDICKQRSAWGTCIGSFCGAYMLYFLITWLPFYLVRGRSFSMSNMGKIGGVAYLFMAGSAALAGWIADRRLAAGATPTRVRKICVTGGQTATAVCLAISVVAGPRLSIALLFLATAGLGVWQSSQWAITQTLAGPRAAGRWTGLQNFVGNLSGIAAPAITGLVVDRTGQFFWAFAITALIGLAGSASWVFLVGPVEQVAWAEQAPMPAVERAAEAA